MRVGKWLFFHACFTVLAFQVPAQAVDLSEAQLRDGLSRLAALVAIDVPKNARWVLVNNESGRFGIFSREEDVFNTEGNAFLFDEKPGVEARIMVMYDGSIYPVKAMKDGGDEDARPMQGEFLATWKNADAAKDAATAAEWLKKEAKSASALKSNSGGRDPFGGRGGDDEAGAKFAASQQTALLWAAMLLHTGQDAPALSLASTALAGTDEAARKQVLDAFFNRLGDQAYGKVMQDFAKHRDWAKLSAELDALVKKFPLGWQMRDAVRVFHHHTAERAKLPAAPLLKTKTALPADAQKMLIDWLKELEAGKQSPYEIWTLPPLTEEGGEVETPRNEMETAFPRSTGLAAVPLLAALLADDTLTLVGLGERGGGFQSRYYGGGGQDEAERLRNSYQSLDKPPTRAHLAWSALERVLPQDLRGSSGNADLTEAIPDILAWHASVKDAATADLALAYIESGQSDESVLAHAIATDDPKKLARLEGAMLESVDIWDLNRLEPFVTKLGPQRGPSFLTKVRQKLEADLSRYQNDASQQERQRKQMESAFKRLEAASKGEKKTPDLQAVLAIAANFDPESGGDDQMEIQDAFQQLPKLMQKLSAPVRIESMVKALPGFKSPQFAAQMLEFAFSGDGEKIPALKPEEHPAVLDATKPHWQKMLETEPTDENLRLQAQVVIRLQELANIKDNFPLFDLLQIGDRGPQMLRDRGLAILAGQKPESLPNPKDIKNEDREKLLADWGTKSPADIASGLKTLPVDQVIALNEKIEHSKDLPAGLKSHISTIHEIKTKNADAAAWQSWKGKAFDKDTLLGLAREVSATKSAGAFTVTLYRVAPLLGFTLHITENKTLGTGWQANYLRNATSAFGDDLPKNIQRVSVGIFQQERVRENWSWFDAPSFDAEKTGAEAGPETKENLERMQGQARASWQKILKALESSKTSRVSVIISTAPVTLLKPADE